MFFVLYAATLPQPKEYRRAALSTFYSRRSTSDSVYPFT